MKRLLTDLQLAAVKRAADAEQDFRARFASTPYIRSISAGDRVTFASLERRGYFERRPWRGDGISRDSAFEYRLSRKLRDALVARSIASRAPFDALAKAKAS